MKKNILALDLVDDEQLIREYDKYHENVWPEVICSIKQAGILGMEIYRISNRLVMIMEVENEFSFESKNEQDAKNPKVQEWEKLMWKYQAALPVSKPGEKWMVMKRIFTLDK